MSTQNSSVLIVGAGAIGAFYGSALDRGGARVSVVCRSGFEAVNRDGFHIKSSVLGDHCFRPYRVFKEIALDIERPDYLILATKVLPELDRVALIRPAIGPRTVIILIQNGVGIEEEIASAFPNNELLTGVSWVGIMRKASNVFDHLGKGSLFIGRYPQGITPAADVLAAMFAPSNVDCRLTEDIASSRWQKMIWNATLGPTSIVSGALQFGQLFRTSGNVAFVRKAMDEVCAIARAKGHTPFTSEVIDHRLALSRTIPGYKTSMAVDFENNLPIELEAILGNVVRAGRDVGVAIPILETLYALATMKQATRVEY